MFEDFHLKKLRQIARAVKTLFEKDFFVRYPELRGKISVLIVGSIATSNYDEYSDIDLDILFSNEKDFNTLVAKIKQYKKEIRKMDIPVQIHRPRTYKEIDSQLKGWERDGMLREYSQAVVVIDPKDKFKKIQSKYRWYPPKIFKEKLLWLFAEMIFEYEERSLTAVKRKDIYFGEITKLKIIKYLLTIILLINKRYPSFDKHLYQDVKKIKSLPDGILRAIDKAVGSHSLTNNEKNLGKVISLLESHLIKRKYITKQSRQYWIDLRPKYKVEMR